MACGAILGGGQARRFGGRNKSALLVQGRTIRERQLDVLRAVTPRILLVGATADACLPADVEPVPDRTPGCGPLGGLDAALAAADGAPVLLVACDMPFLSAALLRAMLADLHGVDAVVPRTERGYHPLCAVYGPACQAAVRRRLEHGALRVRDLFDDVRVRVVEGPDLARFGEPSHLLANVNTQADLDALESLRNH